MCEIVKIEGFVIKKLYIPYLCKIFGCADFEDSIRGRENILQYIEEVETLNKLENDPSLIIQMFDDKPDIKQMAFSKLKEAGGVTWYRYLDMDNPVIRWVNENLEV